VSITLSNEYLGLAQGPIDEKGTSIINAVCGDANLVIGEAVRILPKGVGTSFTQAGDLLPRVGKADFGTEIYGIVVGGDFEGVYSDGVINLDSNNLALETIAAFFGEGVRVCVQGRCLALATGPIEVDETLTLTAVSGNLTTGFEGSDIIAVPLQSTTKANSIIAVDVQREGIIPEQGGLLFYEGSDVNGRRLIRSYLDGTNQVILPLPTPDNFSGLAVDSTSLYIVDIDNNVVIKADLNGNNRVTLPITIGNIGFQIAVDTTSIYVPDFGNSTVIKADLDGSNQQTLPITGLNDPRGVAVDPTSIYVVDNGLDEVIKTDLDGDGQQTIITGLMDSIGIAVDSASIYVTDKGQDAVIIANLDGSSQQTIPITGQSDSTGIAVDSGSFYVTNANNQPPNFIIKADLDGTNQVPFPVFDGTISVTGIAVLEIPIKLFRKVLTVLEADVTGASPLLDFPLLVAITDTDLEDNARTDGFDIFFTKSDGITRIPYERESYNGVTGELRAWLLVDLSDTVDNNFFMFYGNPKSGDQQNPLPVWNTNSRFNDVFHFNQTDFPWINSSIGKDFSFLALDPSLSTGGQIKNGATMGPGIKFASTSNVDVLLDNYYISMWVKLDTFTTRLDDFIDYFSPDGNVAGGRTNLFITSKRLSTTNSEIFATTFENGTPQTNEFFIGDLGGVLIYHHIAVRYSTNSFDLFFDGNFVSSNSFTPATDVIFNFLVGGGGTAGALPFAGRIDELLVAYNSNFSNGFIKTSFDNQKTAGQV